MHDLALPDPLIPPRNTPLVCSLDSAEPERPRFLPRSSPFEPGNGPRVEILDGDELRRSLCRDLAFTRSDRDENVRRIGAVAHQLASNGIVVLIAAISPYREVRSEVRRNIGLFVEGSANAPDVCVRRDPKGLYIRVAAEKSPPSPASATSLERPLQPEVQCDTHLESIRESTGKVLSVAMDRLALTT